MADDNGFAMGYALGQDSGGSGGFGGSFGEGLWAVIILAILFGRGGFGGLGGGTGCNCATQADLAAGFNNSATLSSLNDIKLGQAQAINYSNQGFNGLNTAVLQGFHGVDNAVCNLGYNMQSGFNALGHQLSDCCCTTQRAIDGVNYNMATQFCNLGNTIQNATRDIIDNQNANYRGLMDFMVQEKLSSKDARIAALEGQLGRAEQNSVIRAAIDASTAEILRRTGNECPVPAYVVPNPNCCYGNPLGVGYNGGYGTCGCGCG